MKKIELRLRHSPGVETPVGELAEVDRRLYFEYSPRIHELGWELSPWKLRLQTGLLEHTERSFGPLPGVFDDSLPDGWGLLLMDRHFRRQGREPETVSVLDRLLYLGTRTMGGLTYHPSVEWTDEPGAFDLHELAAHAQRELPEVHGESSVLVGDDRMPRPGTLLQIRDVHVGVSGAHGSFERLSCRRQVGR